MADHINLKDLPTEGERLDFNKVSRYAVMLLGAGGIGLIVSIILLFIPATQKAYGFSWLLGTVFFFTIAVGGIFWTLLHHASNSGWGIAVRRVFERVGSMIWLPGVLMLPLFLISPVKHSLWHWTEIEDNANDKAAQQQTIDNYQAKHDALVAEYQETVKEATAAGNLNEAKMAEAEIAKIGEFDESKIAGKIIKDKDAILYGKHGYLNQPFMWARYISFFVILTFIIFQMRKWSTTQDETGGLKLTFRMRRAACGFLPLFAVAMTFGAIDWVMAIDHHWFSTMYGVYFFAGSALSGMAVIILVVTMLRNLGYLRKVVTVEHYHIMGKLMFAFVIFWAYITFSQFFLIWYANITEETKYFLIRNTEFWNYASIALVVCHFVIPFILLLPAWMKRTPRYLAFMACYVIVVHLLDVYLMIIPMRGPIVASNYVIPGAIIGDLFAVVTVGCLVAGGFLYSLRKYSLFPCRDPRLLESVNAHN